jgi:EAL and modified HD-GYP domain-containing signal transduction protein
MAKSKYRPGERTSLQNGSEGRGMEDNGWSLARRLESWPPPSLSRAISDAGSSEAAPTFVARQPIYDRRLEVFGYEMLFRGADVASAEYADVNAATASTVVTTIADIGLEALVGARTCFVNVTREFILNEFATLLPSDRVALELGRGVAADADVRAKLVELREKGYRIVLDDFVLREDSVPLLAIADMVKLDALSFSDEQLVDQARELTAQGVRLVAERIENHEAFDRCKEAGFELFQGYFFCQPKTVTGKGVPANRLAQMELVAALQNPDVELEELDRVISRDLGVSYRLLRFVNSAYFSLPRRVDSVHDAIVLLGSRNVRSWAMLLTLAEIDDQPSELVRTAMVRAKMGERIAAALGTVDPESAFTVGLFSVLDALMSMRMEDVLSELPLSRDVSGALLSGDGLLGELLSWVITYERGNFGSLDSGSPAADAILRDAYLEAMRWADEATAASSDRD